MPAYERGTVLTGARAIFSIGGQKVGFATGVDISEQIQHEPVTVLDDVFVAEHAPVGVTVSFTAQFFRLVGSSLKRFGYWPAADHLSVITMGEIDASIQDHVTGQTVAYLHRCRCLSRVMNVTSRGIAASSTEWVAIRQTNETGV